MKGGVNTSPFFYARHLLCICLNLLSKLLYKSNALYSSEEVNMRSIIRMVDCAN